MASTKKSGLFKKSPAKSAPYSRQRPLTASAQRLNLTDRNAMQELNNQTNRMAWQDIAWTHYDRIGEIKYAYFVVASMLSRLRVYPGVIMDADDAPVPITDSVTIERPESESEEGAVATQKADTGLTPAEALQVQQIYDDAFRAAKFSTMLRAYSLNMKVPGECYLVRLGKEWKIKSTAELKVDSGGRPTLQRSPGSLPTQLSTETLIGRIWCEHPRYSFEPDSTLRSMADECDELLLLSKLIRSNSRARLNAGLLFVPDTISVASQSATDDEVQADEGEMFFEEQIYQILTGPVSNEDSANTVVPGILRGPAEEGANIQHIKFDQAIDEFLVKRATEVLDRILNAIEAPKETVTGHSGVKFANAVTINENMYKAHIEPLALAFCDALTEIVLHPALKDAGWSADRIAKVTIWYDPSEIVTRPDRAADATALYDRNELSGAGLRTAYGFSENEAPSEGEIAARLALKSTVPEGVVQILLTKVLPTILGKTLGTTGPGALPDSLSEILSGSETPESMPDLGSSAPPPVDSGIATDSSAPADQFGLSPVDVAPLA